MDMTASGCALAKRIARESPSSKFTGLYMGLGRGVSVTVGETSPGDKTRTVSIPGVAPMNSAQSDPVITLARRRLTCETIARSSEIKRVADDTGP